MEHNNITAICMTISKGISASDELLQAVTGKAIVDLTLQDLDAKVLQESFKQERLAAGLWMTNRQLGVNNSEKLADYRQLERWANGQPPSQRREELIASARAQGALKVAITRHKARLEEPAKTAAAVEARDLRTHAKEHGIQPGDCPVTTVWDMERPYRYEFPVVHTAGSVDNAIKEVLAGITGKESKADLLATIEALKAMVA